MKAFKVTNRKPKFFKIIKFLFPAYDWEKHVFTFGNTIYTKYVIHPQTLEHEKVHLVQQKFSKVYAIWHLIKYFTSKEFRFSSELAAFRYEWNYVITHSPRDYHHNHLMTLARNMQHDVYDFGFSVQELMTAISQNARI